MNVDRYVLAVQSFDRLLTQQSVSKLTEIKIILADEIFMKSFALNLTHLNFRFIQSKLECRDVFQLYAMPHECN